MSLGSTPSGSSTAGNRGGGRAAWFQAVAASVDVRDTDSARLRTTAWRCLITDTWQHFTCCNLLTDTWLHFTWYNLITNTWQHFTRYNLITNTWQHFTRYNLITNTWQHFTHYNLITNTWQHFTHYNLLTNTWQHFTHYNLITNTWQHYTLQLDYRHLAALYMIRPLASRLCRTWLHMVVSGLCTKVHNLKHTVTENSYLHR